MQFNRAIFASIFLALVLLSTPALARHGGDDDGGDGDGDRDGDRK